MSASHSVNFCILSRRALTTLLLSVAFFPGEHAAAESASETGYLGTDDPDSIVAIGPIDVSTELQVIGVDVASFGPGDFDGTISADAEANGVLALGGEDLIVITDPVSTDADAQATGAEISGSLSGDGNAEIEVQASAEASGVDGGDQDDDITIIFQHMDGIFDRFLVKITSAGHFGVRKPGDLPAQP